MAGPGKQQGASSSARVTIRCGDGGASSAGQPRRGGSSEGCRGVDCRLPVRGGGACRKQSKALKYSIVANVCAAFGARIPSLRWSALLWRWAHGQPRIRLGHAGAEAPGLSARLGKMSEDPSCAFWIGAPWLASVLQAASITLTLQACLRDVCSTQRCDLRLENHRVRSIASALQACVVAAVQQALHSLETQGCTAAHKMLLRTSLRSMARVRRASTAAAAAPRCVVELISDTM